LINRVNLVNPVYSFCTNLVCSDLEAEMTNVLIPSNEPNLIPYLVEGYQRLGIEAAAGAANFFLRSHSYDLLHILWPEELSGWRPPSPLQLKEIREAVEWWAARAPMMISVNNFYPHGYEGNAAYKELYEIFYSRCDRILHHSKASKRIINDEFPVSAGRPNIISTMFGYHRHIPAERDREKARRSFGFSSEELVVLVFGALRKWEEIELLKTAFRQAKIREKRLLMAGRYLESLGRWEYKRRHFSWNTWLRRQNAVVITQFIPDDEVYRYFEAADVVVIPRLNDLSSGVVGMGMTFGTLIIAPDHGAFPDYLEGTHHLFYKSGDGLSLACAIEKAAELDRPAIRAHSRAIVETWTWDRILRTALADWPAVREFGNYSKAAV
jgi:glycosyltransferase involved in cell wall biosynthesis